MRSAKINHVGMNAQQDCFVAGTEQGVRVFNTSPLSLLKNLDKSVTGNVGFCTVLNRSNIIAMVGNGNSAKFPPNTVMVWDDKKQEFIFEVTIPGGPVLNVLVSLSWLVVVQSRRIHFFTFPNPCSHVRSEEIRLNSKGLAALSADSSNQLLVYPGFKVGSVQVVNMNSLRDRSSLAPNIIEAHLGEIAQLALNKQGTLLATGSEKGTVIRVTDTRTQRLLLECRRGADPASLHCLQFSPCSSFLAVSSDKGTIHVFAIRDNDDTNAKRSLLHQVGLVKGERRSCAQVSIEPRVLACGFVPHGSNSLQALVALCADGTYHRYSFGSEGCAQPAREAFDYFMQLGDEHEFWTQPF